MRTKPTLVAANPSSQVEVITPDAATSLLAQNTMNRNLSRPLVTTYASDMVGGRWMLNGDSIRVACDGTLLDGQHRLYAVIEAGCAVPMFVVRGLPLGAMPTIDAGRKRLAGDVLTIQGFKNANTVAGAARMAILYARGDAVTGDSVSRTEITTFCNERPYIREAATLAVASCARSPLNAGPMTAVLFLANERQLYSSEIAEFAEAVATGASLEKGDPRLTLREWALNERLRNRGTVSTAVMFAAVARGWSGFARGETLKIIKIAKPISAATAPIVGFSPPRA